MNKNGVFGALTALENENFASNIRVFVQEVIEEQGYIQYSLHDARNELVLPSCKQLTISSYATHGSTSLPQRLKRARYSLFRLEHSQKQDVWMARQAQV